MQYNNNIIITWDDCEEHISVIYLVHTKELHHKVLVYVIYSFISSPATKVICYRHLGHTYNSSTATSVIGILINRFLGV